MKKTTLNRCVAASVFIAAAFATSAASAQSNELYGGVGTDGVGVGFGHSFNQYAGVRAELDGFSISHHFTSGDLNYNANLRLIHGGLFGDFFPAAQVLPFHFTAGVIVGGDELSGDAVSSNGQYTINGATVMAASGESIHATLKFPTVRPYIGIGFGHSLLSKKGLSMAFDAGVAFGRPSVSFDVPADVAAQAGAQNIAAEEQSLRDKANNLKFYPIIKVSVTYRF